MRYVPVWFLFSGVGRDPVSREREWVMGYMMPDRAVLLGIEGPMMVSVITRQ